MTSHPSPTHATMGRRSTTHERLQPSHASQSLSRALVASGDCSMKGSTSPSRADIVRGYPVLPHAVPIVVVMAATAAFALVAGGGWPGGDALAALLGAMFGGQLAVGAMNELADAELDAVSKPQKPIPAGLVTQRGAMAMVIAGLLLMCLCSLRFSFAAFGLCALGTGTGIAYSLVFKRTIWSWIPYVIALPLLPIWVWSALDRVDPGLFAIYPIGLAAVIAVNLPSRSPISRVTRVPMFAPWRWHSGRSVRCGHAGD